MKDNHEDFRGTPNPSVSTNNSTRWLDPHWHSDWQSGASASCLTSDQIPDDASVAGKVRSIQRARINRSRLFDPDLFADPAWDILLDLYASSLEQRRVSVAGLGAASGVPATTSLRWVTVLEERELIVRRTDPLDGRRVFVMLTAKGSSIMREYFQTLPEGISPL